MNKKTWKTKQLKNLAKAFAHMDSATDIANFLRDLCTREELEEMSRRFEVAELLDKEKTYRDIAEKTGVSTTTVTRIAHWKREGEGGYEAALRSIQK